MWRAVVTNKKQRKLEINMHQSSPPWGNAIPAGHVWQWRIQACRFGKPTLTPSPHFSLLSPSPPFPSFHPYFPFPNPARGSREHCKLPQQGPGRSLDHKCVSGRPCYILPMFFFIYYPPFASIAKGEVFVLLYVFLFFCFFVCSVNDFSATRGPIHAIFCMRA